ncbi:MAG: hypothetical protein IKU44_01390 [Firmicutes bacterium]|nr:hypothetical protein [Bacillota bacterium]
MTFITYVSVGFIASSVLIFLAKFLMAGLLQQKPNYYDDQYDVVEPSATKVEGGEDHA